MNDIKKPEGGPPGNTKALKHGLHAFEANVNRGIQPFEIDSLKELREALALEPARTALRIEIIARLTIMARKLFADQMDNWNNPTFWSKDLIKRGGTYLAELRRYLDSMPPDKGQGEVIDAMIVSLERTDTDDQEDDGGNDGND